MRLAAKGENIYWSQNKATLSGALGAPSDYAKCYLAGTKFHSSDGDFVEVCRFYSAWSTRVVEIIRHSAHDREGLTRSPAAPEREKVREGRTSADAASSKFD